MGYTRQICIFVIRFVSVKGTPHAAYFVLDVTYVC